MGSFYQDKDQGFLGVLLAPEVVEWAGKYSTVTSEGYDNKPFEALKDGLSRVILTRAEEGPIRANNTLIRTDGLSRKM